VDPLDGLTHHLLWQLYITARLHCSLTPTLLLLWWQWLLLLLLATATSIGSHFSTLRTHIFKPIKRSSTIIVVTSCHHIWQDCCKIFLVDDLPKQNHIITLFCINAYYKNKLRDVESSVQSQG
jgi:hypothetical protein